MKIGFAFNLTSFGKEADPEVYRTELRLADLAEPLGYDSIWTLEHHFTGYTMIPNPLQLLTYIAARTSSVLLGTAVIVLPWHHPLRVAEEISVLDILSGGRVMFGFGRGAGSVEFEGFGIKMEEARERFVEAAVIIRKALTLARFSHHGKFFDIPEISIRPRPISNPEQRFYASTVSPESALIMASNGFSPMIIAQREWMETAKQYERYRQIALEHGFNPQPPIALLHVLISRDQSEADELRARYTEPAYDAIENHYRFADGHLANVKGYEFYAQGLRQITPEGGVDPEAKQKALEYYGDLHLSGTTARVLEQIREIRRLTNLSHLLCQFRVGGMPGADAERGMRLFAEQVLPIVRSDRAFAD